MDRTIHICSSQEDAVKIFNRKSCVVKKMLLPLAQNARVVKIRFLTAILTARPFRCRGAPIIVKKSLKTSVAKKNCPDRLLALGVVKILNPKS